MQVLGLLCEQRGNLQECEIEKVKNQAELAQIRVK
jgi:hypothetical protein